MDNNDDNDNSTLILTTQQKELIIKKINDIDKELESKQITMLDDYEEILLFSKQRST